MSTEQPQSNRLYVGNIPWSTTVEELQGLFTDAENIEIPTVRFTFFFFCFYIILFDSIALGKLLRKTFRADDSFFHRRRLNALSLRNLSAKPPRRSPKSAENEERFRARKKRFGKVLRGHAYRKRERKESEMS